MKGRRVVVRRSKRLQRSRATELQCLDTLPQARHRLDANDRMVPIRIPTLPRRTKRDNDAIR